MGPETDIDLLRLHEVLNTGRGLGKQRTEFLGLLGPQLADREAVPKRLHEQCADTKRSHAMLDYPVIRGMNASTRKFAGTGGQVAGEARGFHVVPCGGLIDNERCRRVSHTVARISGHSSATAATAK
jgi:hypothetical protein